MKAKKIISENSEQLNPLPVPSNEESKDQLAPWQKLIVALAEARLSVDDEQDLVPEMLRRAIGLCRTVEEMALGESQSEISPDALAKVMQVIEEHVQIAKWITSGRPLRSNWF
jgi:Cdc6-like AAA superfamily ATPase